VERTVLLSYIRPLVVDNMSAVIKPVMRCPRMGDYNALIFEKKIGWGRVYTYQEKCYRDLIHKGRPPHIIKWDNGELQTLNLKSGMLRFTFDHNPTNIMRRPPTIAQGFSFGEQEVTGYYILTQRPYGPGERQNDGAGDYDVMEIGGEGDEFDWGAVKKRNKRDEKEHALEDEEFAASAGGKPKQSYYKRVYPDL